MVEAPRGSPFRSITPGIETLACSFSLPRHRHLRPYVSVVLKGEFEEAGYIGRIRARVGDVLIHPELDCHENQMVAAGLKLLRLEWSCQDVLPGLYLFSDIDGLARSAEKDLGEAMFLLREELQKKHAASPGCKNDWPDLLLRDLSGDPALEIGTWAESNGLARETVSRGFAKAYGVAPSVLRAELRTRTAWLQVTRTKESLCSIAADAGFADQAHMTRWIHRVTGKPPSAWRGQVQQPNKNRSLTVSKSAYLCSRESFGNR